MDSAALPLVLLPGLHGSVRLFDPLVSRLREASPRRKFLPLPLPTDTPQDYPALRDHFVGQLEKLGPFELLAESFSAPLALHLAASPRLSIVRLILAGAYCAAPRCAAFRLLPLRRIFALNPPKSAVRHFLVGKNASEDLVNSVRTEIQSVRGRVLAERTLLLQARHDALLPQKARAALESHLPDAQVVRIDAPHLLLQVAPDRCAAAIGKLLRGET